ncbi:CBN-ADA-2 protein [Aphelenchoides avenae]|nr:CBN-ADA-2 protein [Aphelenchus avenae]
MPAMDDLNQKRQLTVKVVLKRVSLADCYAMQNEDPNVTSTDADPHDHLCAMCCESLKGKAYVRCREGDNATLCPECFSVGAEPAGHKRNHNYEVNDPRGLSVFESDGLPCGYNMELEMLAAFQNYTTETWKPEGIDLSKVDPTDLVLQRIDEHFLRGSIGRYIMKSRKWPVLKEVDPSVARQAEESKHVVDYHGTVPESVTLHPNGGFVLEDAETGREAELCIDNSGQVFDKESAVTTRLVETPPKMSDVEEPQASSWDDERDGIVGRTFGQSPRKYSISFTEDNESKSDTKERMKAAKAVKDDVAERVSGCTWRGSHAEESSSEDINARRSFSASSPVASPTDEGIQLRSRRSLVASTPDEVTPRGPMSPEFSSHWSLTSPPSSSSSVKHEVTSPTSRIYPTRSRLLSGSHFPDRNEVCHLMEHTPSSSEPEPRWKIHLLYEGLDIPADTPNKSSSRPRKRNHRRAAANVLDNGDFSAEAIRRLRAEHPHHFFYQHRVPQLPETAVERLNKDELSAIAYTPRRDEFELEYANEAEKLLSHVIMPPASPGAMDDSAKFLQEVKLARMRQYNRVLGRRIAKHGAVREYEMLAEFFSLQKSGNHGEPYKVFPKGTFMTKEKEDEFRPMFCRLRQVATKDELDSLAQKIGKMEALKEDIRKLQELQRSGETELKGRLKSGSVTPVVKRKKKGKQRFGKPPNRKQMLNWQHKLRYNKKLKQEEELDYDE